MIRPTEKALGFFEHAFRHARSEIKCLRPSTPDKTYSVHPGEDSLPTYFRDQLYDYLIEPPTGEGYGVILVFTAGKSGKIRIVTTPCAGKWCVFRSFIVGHFNLDRMA